MTLADQLVDQYGKFETENARTAPENMVAWLRSAGRARAGSLKAFDDAFEKRGLDLREELHNLADALVIQIGEEEVNAVMDEEPRDNNQIKKLLLQSGSFLNFATEVTARFE